MSKKVLFPLVLSLALSSCSQAYNTSFTIYFGNMYISKDSYNYQAINQKLCQNEFNKDISEEYYANIYFFYDQETLEEFQQNESYYDHGETISIPSDHFLIYFFAQAPASYRAIKRENIQYIDENDREVLVTDNFYQLASRKDIAYCFIDLELDITISSPYVFSFYYYVSNVYRNNLNFEDIRIILAS